MSFQDVIAQSFPEAEAKEAIVRMIQRGVKIPQREDRQ
jgi:hypothetical protein